MKRRLSVAIAAIGSPLMVLDEPTTGMDPVNRASVWRVIERLKANRCIVMSTHRYRVGFFMVAAAHACACLCA